jgi:transketolase
MAEITSVLFFNVMHYDPKDPQNPASDRFVLSKVNKNMLFSKKISIR